MSPTLNFRRGLRRRRPRGWVLIAVLAFLALLSMLVAGFFLEAEATATTGRTNAMRLLASAHAEFGLQDAIRALRNRQLDLSAVVGACTDNQVETLTCPGMFVSPLADNGNAQELQAGGGLSHQYFIFKRIAAADIGVPPNRYVVRSVGYAGFNLTSPNLTTSIVEAEVDVGESSQFRCIGGYECQ